MSDFKCLKTETGVTVLILLAPFVVIMSLGCEACSTTKKVIIFWENEKTNTLTGYYSGFSIEGGTRRLIAAYFGIYSRLLCV